MTNQMDAVNSLHTIPASLLARLLGRAKGILAFQTVDGVLVPWINGSQIQREAIRAVEETESLFWSNITVHLSDGTSQVVRGLRKRDATRAADWIQIYSAAAAAKALLFDLEQLAARRYYLGFRVFDGWLKEARPLADWVRKAYVRTQSSSPDFITVAELVRLVDEGERARGTRNEAFVAAERVRYQDRFAQVQGYPLNDDQVNAILHDEDRALVVAGAGAGKTSTIVGKVDYLLAAGLARPEELLLLAYTRKAAEEMRHRIQRLTGQEVAVQTFHALGLQVYSESKGERPTLSRFVDDKEVLDLALRSYIERMLEDPATREKVIEFLAFYRYPLRDEKSFKSEHDRHQYARGHDLRDLKGTRMKSVQETMIANWLLLNGIEYKYEEKYEHPTKSVQFRQYHPDFYLPDYGIYIEHFGIDREGKPPAFFTDPQKYVEGIHWKRGLHKTKGTKLVETFSYQAFEGTLFDTLASALGAHGVEFRPTDPNACVRLLRHSDGISQFIDVIRSFLSLFKGNAWAMESTRGRVAASKDLRTEKFLDLFEEIFRQYQTDLATERAIDFDDMIVESAAVIEAGCWRSPYRYLIVDEFQDISLGRAKLLKALLGQVPDSKLFCVGDDWQSIFRFAGSDIDLMTNFGVYFGRFRRTDLRQTHRFGSNLLAASSKFVMSNPQQLKKEPIAAHTDNSPSVEVHSGAQSHNEPFDLSSVIERIWIDAASWKGPSSGDIEVLLLGRNKFVNDRYLSYQRLRGLNVRVMTVHKAKGSEADYAILLDVVGGRLGFPTEIVDDPVLDLVLAGKYPFPHAEERRLFYVALTRARRKTYVITHDIRRSVFIDEIESGAYAGLVTASGAPQTAPPCPRCGGGRLEKRKGELGEFYGCSNFPMCKGKARVCPACKAGAWVKRGNELVCHNPPCGNCRDICPRCEVGYLRTKTGRHGKFWGCSEWRQDEAKASCNYTRKIRREY